MTERLTLWVWHAWALLACLHCSIELQDDRNMSYIQALKDNVQLGITRMVVCVLPNNRKDRYDALKVFLCVENPGYWQTNLLICDDCMVQALYAVSFVIGWSFGMQKTIPVIPWVCPDSFLTSARYKSLAYILTFLLERVVNPSSLPLGVVGGLERMVWLCDLARWHQCFQFPLVLWHCWLADEQHPTFIDIKPIIPPKQGKEETEQTASSLMFTRKMATKIVWAATD